MIIDDLIHALQIAAYIDRWTLFIVGLAMGLYVGTLVGVGLAYVFTR